MGKDSTKTQFWTKGIAFMLMEFLIQQLVQLLCEGRFSISTFYVKQIVVKLNLMLWIRSVPAYNDNENTNKLNNWPRNKEVSVLLKRDHSNDFVKPKPSKKERLAFGRFIWLSHQKFHSDYFTTLTSDRKIRTRQW